MIKHPRMPNLPAPFLEPLRVVAESPASGEHASLEFDAYVPLRFRTSAEPLGVAYVRIGNFATTLLEIQVEPLTQVLRGLTITATDGLSGWPWFEVQPVRAGLPVLATEFASRAIIDIAQPFQLAVRTGEVVVWWGSLDGCIAGQCGDATFLLTGGMLTGIWFTGLPAAQTALLQSTVLAHR
jgi:hypothetical protein